MFKNKLMHLMPYLESDGAAGTGGADKKASSDMPAGAGSEGKDQDKNGSDKKYTDAEVDAIIDKKFAKWQSDHEKKLEEEKKKADEAAKLAAMNATEKAEYEKKQALQEAEEAKKKLALYDMAKTARGMLAEKKISLNDDLLSNLVDADAEKTKANIDAFVELFNQAVDAEVKERLKGKTPSAGAGKATMKKEDIMAIKDPVERQKAIMNNKEMFGL